MFDLSDAILARNTTASRFILSRLLETTTPYEIIPTLIGILRGSLYAKYLQSIGKKEKEIGSIIPIHPYVLSKTLASKISYKEISEIYTKLVDANIAYKSGRGLKDGEL